MANVPEEKPFALYVIKRDAVAIVWELSFTGRLQRWNTSAHRADELRSYKNW